MRRLVIVLGLLATVGAQAGGYICDQRTTMVEGLLEFRTDGDESSIRTWRKAPGSAEETLEAKGLMKCLYSKETGFLVARNCETARDEYDRRWIYSTDLVETTYKKRDGSLRKYAYLEAWLRCSFMRKTPEDKREECLKRRFKYRFGLTRCRALE